MKDREPAYFKDRGAYFVCPTCKKVFYIEDREVWAYKRNVTLDKNGSQMVYFHTYSCKKKFDKEYDKQIKQNRQDGAFKRTIVLSVASHGNRCSIGFHRS